MSGRSQDLQAARREGFRMAGVIGGAYLAGTLVYRAS